MWGILIKLVTVGIGKFPIYQLGATSVRITVNWLSDFNLHT